MGRVDVAGFPWLWLCVLVTYASGPLTEFPARPGDLIIFFFLKQKSHILVETCLSLPLFHVAITNYLRPGTL